MLVFIRHAERGDNQFPIQHSQISYDPPITTESTQTIFKAASELIEIFKASGIERINIEASKFLRCLMTAERLAEHFIKAGLAVAAPKRASNRITEYMREDWFKKYPLDDLIFDSGHAGKYVRMGEWKEEPAERRYECPENYVMFHRRIGEYRKGLKFPKEGECTILVTHGLVLRELCWRMHQVADYSAEIKYCGYAVYAQKGQKETLIRSKL